MGIFWSSELSLVMSSFRVLNSIVLADINGTSLPVSFKTI